MGREGDSETEPVIDARTNESVQPVDIKQYVLKRGRELSAKRAEEFAQLPFPEWPEDRRAAPNVAIRSALFGVVKRGRRAFVEDREIPAVGRVTVHYSGIRLDQSDLDIFLQLIHFARNTTPGDRVKINLYSLLKAIGRGVGSSDYKWLKTRLKQMTSSSTTITETDTGRTVTIGGLIRKWGQDPRTGEGYVETNPDMRRLFDEDEYTLINFNDRLSLTSDLQKWLHAYYQSHAKAYPVKVETLRRLCGSDTKLLKHFRANLRDALEALRQRGYLISWNIQPGTDLVTVFKQPTPSQARYLARQEAQAQVRSLPAS